MRTKLTRQDLRDELARWAAGEIGAVDVYNWANDRFADDDCSPEDPVTNEILWCLESLDMTLLTVADIPTLVSALTPAITTATEARSLVNRRLDAVGRDERRRALRHDALYHPFSGH
jgi:hypothetical protein